MIQIVFNSLHDYIADSVNQWSVGQYVTISGLDLDYRPVILFTDLVMGRCISKESVLNEDGSISAPIPDSILQQPYDITCYVSTLNDDGGYTTVTSFLICMNEMRQPQDYTMKDPVTNDCYSFEKMNQEIQSFKLETLEEVQKKLDAVTTAYNEMTAAMQQYTAQVDTMNNTVSGYNSQLQTVSGKVATIGDTVDKLNYDSGWIMATPGDGVELYPRYQARYRQTGKDVEIRGEFRLTADNTNGSPILMVLPEKFRPSGVRTFDLMQGSGANKFAVDISPTTGEVRVGRYGTTSNATSIASGTWFTVHVSYTLG